MLEYKSISELVSAAAGAGVRISDIVLADQAEQLELLQKGLSGDREKEMYGRYEETAYFWRMLKLVGHPDATIYEFDGFNHVTMLLPGFAVAAEFIKKHRK